MEFIIPGIALLFIVTYWFLPKRSQQITSPLSATGTIDGPGEFDFDIVGESFYQQNLSKICGRKTEDGHRLFTTATIIPYDTNPKDDQAVRVEINGLIVGHFAKDSARTYRSQLLKNGIAGSAITCNAIIVGGWDRGSGDTGHFGVKLDLPIN